MTTSGCSILCVFPIFLNVSYLFLFLNVSYLFPNVSYLFPTCFLMFLVSYLFLNVSYLFPNVSYLFPNGVQCKSLVSSIVQNTLSGQRPSAFRSHRRVLFQASLKTFFVLFL
jgi:hypothetical protein